MRQGLGIAIFTGLLAASATGASAGETTKAERAVTNGEIVLDHYPPESLKAGEEGTVHFRVTLDKDGGLTTCAVTESSGFPRLDSATCDMLVATARFRRAEDATGPRQRAIHDGTVVWKLPAGLAKAERPTPAPPTTVKTEDLADAALICRRVPKLGGIYVKTKMCLTKEDWARARDNAQRETKEMQETRGPLRF